PARASVALSPTPSPPSAPPRRHRPAARESCRGGSPPVAPPDAPRPTSDPRPAPPGRDVATASAPAPRSLGRTASAPRCRCAGRPRAPPRRCTGRWGWDRCGSAWRAKVAARRYGAPVTAPRRERKSITGPPGTVAARLARRTAPHPARRRWVSCRVPHTPSSPHPDFGTAYRNGTLDAFFDLTPGDVAGALAQPRTVRRT